MSKFIFITGGVVSSLGKGIAYRFHWETSRGAGFKDDDHQM